MHILQGITCHSQRIPEKQVEITSLMSLPEEGVAAGHTDGTISFWKKKQHVIDQHFGFQKLPKSTLKAHEHAILGLREFTTHVQIGNNSIQLNIIITTTAEDTKIWSTDWHCFCHFTFPLGKFDSWKEQLVSYTPGPSGNLIQLRVIRVSDNQTDISLHQIPQIDSSEQLIQYLKSEKLYLQFELLQSVKYLEKQDASVVDFRISNNYLILTSHLDTTSQHFWRWSMINSAQFFSLTEFRFSFVPHWNPEPEAFELLHPVFIPCKDPLLTITPEDERKPDQWKSKMNYGWPIPPVGLEDNGTDTCCAATMWHENCATLYPKARTLKVWSDKGECIVSVHIAEVGTHNSLYDLHGILWGIFTTNGQSQIVCWKMTLTWSILKVLYAGWMKGDKQDCPLATLPKDVFVDILGMTTAQPFSGKRIKYMVSKTMFSHH